MVPLFLRLKRTPGSIPQKLKRVDWVGNFLFIGSTTSFLIPVTWGGIQFPWDSPSTLVPLLVGIAGMVGFWFYEKKVAVEPTIKLNLLKNYNMAYSMYATVINALIVYGALYFLPLYFEAAKGYNPVVAGVALFPATFTVAPLSIIAGFIITKTGDYRVVTWIGWIATTLGCGVMVLLDADSTIPQWVFLTFCMGIGLGLLYTSLVFITQTASDDSSMAFAIGMFVFARILGQCIGVAICGTIFQNQMRENLLDIPSLAEQAHEYSRDATSLVQAIKVMPDSTMKTELIGAYADSLKIVWAVMCVLSTTALVGSFFVRKYSLDRALNTEQGLVDGKKGKEKSDVN